MRDEPVPRPVPGRGLLAEELMRGRAVYGHASNKDSYLKRLRRIEGQVRGLQRMVNDDEYCIDILTQVSVTRALQPVAIGLLRDHLGHCVTDAVDAGDGDASAKITEASEAVARLVSS